MSHTQSNASSTPTSAGQTVPDPEVVVKAQRRQFTAAYKHRILQEADACVRPGDIGALLRREGLYSSHLNTWRHQRARGEQQGLTPAKRGRKAQLARAELIIEVQKKVSQLLGLPEIPRSEGQ